MTNAITPNSLIVGTERRREEAAGAVDAGGGADALAG
jgi:hypothetical protein